MVLQSQQQQSYLQNIIRLHPIQLDIQQFFFQFTQFSQLKVRDLFVQIPLLVLKAITLQSYSIQSVNILQMYKQLFQSVDVQNQSLKDQTFQGKYYFLQNYSQILDGIQSRPLQPRERIQRELLKAFDGKQKSQSCQSMPKGIPSSRLKFIQAVPSKSINFLKGTLPVMGAFQLKAIQQAPRMRTLDNQTNRTSHSRLSAYSNNPPHHNKRKSFINQFNQKKQNEKIVQRLLCIKSSKQVNRQGQLRFYQNHLKHKNIMLHRVDQPNKIKNDFVILRKNSLNSKIQKLVLKSNKQFNDKKKLYSTKDRKRLQQIRNSELRRMLKQQKIRNRLQSINKRQDNLKISNFKDKKRFKTQQAQLIIMPPSPSFRTLVPLRSYVLPQIKSFSKVQSVPARNINKFQLKQVRSANRLRSNCF